jgi:hypothetical protein
MATVCHREASLTFLPVQIVVARHDRQGSRWQSDSAVPRRDYPVGSQDSTTAYVARCPARQQLQRHLPRELTCKHHSLHTLHFNKGRERFGFKQERILISPTILEQEAGNIWELWNRQTLYDFTSVMNTVLKLFCSWFTILIIVLLSVM